MMNSQTQVHAAVSQSCPNDEKDHLREQADCDGDNFTFCLRLFVDWKAGLLVQIMAVRRLLSQSPVLDFEHGIDF